MASGKRRKFLVALGILVIGVLLFVFAAPLWTPWILQPLLARWNVHFKSYQRIGYDRLELRDISYRSTNLTFHADRAVFHQPGVWFLRHWSGQFTSEDLRVENWQISIRPPAKKKNKATHSIDDSLQNLDMTLAELEPWLATAYLKKGEVVFGDQQLLIPQLVWNRGTATASIAATNGNVSAVISAHLKKDIKQLSINASSPLALEADLNLQSRADLLLLSGQVFWQSNTAQLAATFAPDELLPRSASFQSRSFRIPAALVRLEGYEDLTGTLSAEWRTNSFAVDLDALASPRNETNLPPVQANIHASGTTNFVRIERAGIATPWLTAQISTNVAFNFEGELLSPEAAIRVVVDLDKQELVEATGQLTGTAFLTRSEKQYPEAAFTLNSVGFTGFGVRLENANITGQMDWPWVTIDSSEITFADGGVANFTSRYNAVGRFFDTGTVNFKGQIGHEFLPPQLSYTNISLAAKFSGSLQTPVHSGKIEVSGLKHESVGQVRIAAEWHGKLLEFDGLSAEIEARQTLLRVSGSGALSTNHVSFQLEEAALQQTGKTFLRLQHPAKISIEKKDLWSVAFTQLALQAEDRELFLEGDFQWPDRGFLSLSAQNIHSEWFERFLQKDLGDLYLKNLQLQASWTNGPVQFQARSNARFAVDDANSFVVRFDATSDSQGILIEHMDLLSDSGPVLSGEGRLPFRIFPSDTNGIFQLSRTEPINFRADTVPNKAVWDQIAKLTKLRLTDPNLHLKISGSLQDPKGTMALQAREASWLGTNAQHFPPLENVRADLHFTDETIRIETLNLTVEGQPIAARAELPIGDDFSRPLRTLFDWRKASGRVQVQDAAVSAFVKYLPEMLTPQGVVNADISFTPGPQLNGSLVIANAATRPLPSTGPLHDIQARLRFIGQQIEFEDVRGLLGGQPVGFLGRIDFGTKRPGNLPLMDLYFRGENVPLARRTDLVLRSDLNLHLSNLTNDIPLISGNVRLRDSFYLGDLRQLIPGRVASPKRRPPYFNVESEPFSNWRVDVAVSGENFLRARSPIFQGSVSANLRLGGPLKEPILIGDVPIETGTILFPFANFRVQQGFITLTSENPYEPQLYIRAESRAFSYDIETTLRGAANNPIIEFSSTPPLSSEQIILMVTAGEVPRQGFGFSQEQRAQRLALFVGKSVLSRLTDGAGAERLSITTGEDISEQGQETYALEYKINEDWSIVGEYDRFGALNVGMKWRIYSR